MLFDFASQGGLGWANWALSWLTLALFVAFGVRLLVKAAVLNACDEETQSVSEGTFARGEPEGRASGREGVEERRRGEGGKTPRLPFSVISALSAAGLAGALVFAARCVPPGGAPRVRGGYAASGAAPRTLALYDGSWSLRDVRARAGRDALVPVRPVSRFPRDLDFSSVGRVLLFGDCREWAYLVPKGVSVTCAED